jgi:hypothetical protein
MIYLWRMQAASPKHEVVPKANTQSVHLMHLSVPNDRPTPTTRIRAQEHSHDEFHGER